LRKALSELRVQFDRWDRGEIDVFGRPIVDRVVVVDGRTNEERIIFFSVDNRATIRR
jgi:hypothetical protein